MDEYFAPSGKDPLVTNRLGEYAVTKVILRAMEKGYPGVFKPVIECRVDLVLDDGLKLYRAQVKYAGRTSPRQCRGAVPLGLRKWRNGGRSVTLCYTASEIDALLVYVRKIDNILWLGPEIFDGRKNLQIRLEPCRNNQMKGCLMAADYIW
ncbi:MAG: group I intron-associated PD-(D/E)XK endonuclease [Gemmataceae bacterium]